MSKEEIRLIKGYFNDGYCCDLDELRDIANKMINENKRLHSIIKEVREYAKEVLSWTTNEPITDEIGEHILEIVGKENKE